MNASRVACAALVLVATASITVAQSRRDGGRSDRGDRSARSGDGAASTAPSTMAAATGPLRPGASTRPADYYNVVVDRNIFVRERRRPVPPVIRTTAPVRPPLPLEQTLVLQGVVLDYDSYRAYFQNTQTGETVRVVAGDVLAKGHVAEISIDAVSFEGPAGLVWVKVGDNLVGTRVATAPAATPTVAAGTTTGPAGESDVARRLRERREAEQQRRGSGR